MNTAPVASHTPADGIGHAHVADLDACLELVNTLALDDGIARDHLATPADALAFLVAGAFAHEDALRAQAGTGARAEAWLARVRRVRSALREVWDAAVEGRTVDGDALTTLNDVLAHAPHAELRAGIAGVLVGHRHETDDPTGEALARLAEPLVTALAAGDTDRFRICANDGCRWVFEDTSRGGRRRWCDMSSCGNRAKVRRFRSRRRSAGDATVGTAGAAGE